jgi:hypothetical protein
MSVLAHVNVVNVHDVLNKVVVYIILNSIEKN